MKSFSKIIACFILISCTQFTLGETNRLLEFFTVGKKIQAEFIQVIDDPSLAEYGKLFSEAQQKDPKWFSEHLKKGKPGCPIDFDEKIMTKEQYDGYLASWDKRKIVAMKGQDGKNLRVDVVLSNEGEGNYVLNIKGVPISSLVYSAKNDAFTSMAGEIKYFGDIDVPKENSLGAWTGYEWKGDFKSSFSSTKQHLAIGRTGDKKYGILLFSSIQLSGNTVLARNNILMRFAPVK